MHHIYIYTVFTSCFGSEISFFKRVANYGSRKLGSRLETPGRKWIFLTFVGTSLPSPCDFSSFTMNNSNDDDKNNKKRPCTLIYFPSARKIGSSWSLSGTDMIQKRLHVISSDRRLTHTRYSVSLSKKNAPPRGTHGQIKNVWYATVLAFLVAQQQQQQPIPSSIELFEHRCNPRWRDSRPAILTRLLYFFFPSRNEEISNESLKKKKREKLFT